MMKKRADTDAAAARLATTVSIKEDARLFLFTRVPSENLSA